MKSNVGGLLVAGLLVVTVPGMATAAEELKFAGSTTVMEVLEPLQQVFQTHGIHIQIQGNGSGAGVASLRMGMAQVGMISRDPSQSERKNFRVYTIAKDIVVLIVNRANNVKDISSNDVRAIYVGEKKTWPDGSTINVISKEAGRGTREVFDEKLDLVGKIRRDAAIVGSNGQTIASVAKDKSAIAYVSYASAHVAIRAGEPISILSLDGVEPTPELVLKGAYKLGRSLNLLFKPEFQTHMDRVVEVLQTPAAVERMRRVGVVPVSGTSAARR